MGALARGMLGLSVFCLMLLPPLASLAAHGPSRNGAASPARAVTSVADVTCVSLSSIRGWATNPASPCVRLALDAAGQDTVELAIERRERLREGRWISRGRVAGQAGSYVTLAVSGQAVAGSIFVPGRGLFQIQGSGQRAPRLVEVDWRRSPACGRRSRAGTATESHDLGGFLLAAAGAAAPAPAPTNTIVDVLVVYTSAARIGAGGTDEMTALVDAAVAEANLAFTNSEVNATLRLVHTAEVSYRETGDIGDDLDRLEDPDEDSPLMEVHRLRGEHRADLVCMITETTGGPFGLANQMRELEVDFGEKAFSIVQRQYALSYQAFAHELGHNMGCQHDRETSPGGGVHDYSHAHRFEVEGMVYHTVMAYPPGLPIPYFSNPDVLFLGVPTGIDEAATNSANNARTLNRTVSTVARFDSTVRVGRPPTVSLVSPTNGAAFTVPAVVEVTAEASDSDGVVTQVEFYVNGVRVATLTEPPYTLQWTNSTPGTYSFRAEAEDNTGWDVFSSRATVRLRLPDPSLEPLGSQALVDGRFQLRVRGVDGQAFRLEASTDLIGWELLLTDSLFGDTLDYVDDFATNHVHRFYRVLPLP